MLFHLNQIHPQRRVSAQWFRISRVTLIFSVLPHKGEGPEGRDENRDPQCHLPAGQNRQPVRPADHLPERQQHKEHLCLPRRRKGQFTFLPQDFVSVRRNGMDEKKALPQHSSLAVARKKIGCNGGRCNEPGKLSVLSALPNTLRGDICFNNSFAFSFSVIVHRRLCQPSCRHIKHFGCFSKRRWYFCSPWLMYRFNTHWCQNILGIFFFSIRLI